MNIDDYYKMLGNSKICVCPDGTSIDTFRFVEACGSRCAIITTRKPDLWYYKEAPVFYLDNWVELTAQYVQNVLNSGLDELQEEVEIYYNMFLSERAVASYIVSNIYRQ
jgi:hypothetical protein